MLQEILDVAGSSLTYDEPKSLLKLSGVEDSAIIYIQEVFGTSVTFKLVSVQQSSFLPLLHVIQQAFELSEISLCVVEGATFEQRYVAHAKLGYFFAGDYIFLRKRAKLLKIEDSSPGMYIPGELFKYRPTLVTSSNQYCNTTPIGIYIRNKMPFLLNRWDGVWTEDIMCEEEELKVPLNFLRCYDKSIIYIQEGPEAQTIVTEKGYSIFIQKSVNDISPKENCMGWYGNKPLYRWEFGGVKSGK